MEDMATLRDSTAMVFYKDTERVVLDKRVDPSKPGIVNARWVVQRKRLKCVKRFASWKKALAYATNIKLGLPMCPDELEKIWNGAKDYLDWKPLRIIRRTYTKEKGLVITKMELEDSS